MNYFRELMALVEALNKADLPYAFCGGVAVNYHGFVRATEDIDLLVPPEHIAAIKRVARTIGYTIQKPEPIEFAKGTPDAVSLHRVIKFEGEDYLMLDIIEVGPANAYAWESRSAQTVSGAPFWCISRNALLEMKRRSGRARDLFDIEGLEGRLES